jgi:hypothetical protein
MQIPPAKNASKNNKGKCFVALSKQENKHTSHAKHKKKVNIKPSI